MTAAPAGSLVLRRAIPLSLIPLALAGCGLASAPWLRAFPSSFLAVPLFGAVVLSVLLPVVVIAIGIRTLWLTALIDVVGFVGFTMLVALHSPAGFSSLYRGLVDGPSQILTYALPLVNQRTLLVAPVALCWLSGAILGECIGRGWQSLLPYATLLVTFGLSYAGSARAITSADDGRRYDTILAAALLLTMLLLRAAQAWLEQDAESDPAMPEAALPLRGLAVGVLVSLLVAALAASLAQSSAFVGEPRSPARTPPDYRTEPVSPVSFVAGLRPADPASTGKQLFQVTFSRRSTNYVAIADVDNYDGDGWSLGERRFRPSGGTIPADTDPFVRSRGGLVTQRYRIAAGALTGGPWMPFLYRPEQVSGVSVGIDPGSGMVVPTASLRAGDRFTVQSRPPRRTFGAIPATSLAGTSPPPSATELGQLATPLTDVVRALKKETATEGAPPIVFLQALEKDLRSNYALAGSTTARSASSSPSSPPAASPSSSPRPPSRSGTASTPTPPGTQTSGGTSFATVLAAILGQTRSATPEQYATLVALVARRIGVPARLVTGFRIPPTGGTPSVPAGTYQVSTAAAWTWVEVPIRGYGWVVLDASPGRYSGPKATPSASPRPSLGLTPTATPNVLIPTDSADGQAVAPPSSTPGPPVSGPAIAGLVVAGVVVLLLLLVAMRLGQKRQRTRRRRRRGDARRRVIGAWQEALDVLAECGLSGLANLTSTEVASVAGSRFGARAEAQVRHLGVAANAAIFKPTSTVVDSDADDAWRVQAMLQRSARRSLRWRERLAAALRYHHPDRVRRPIGPASWAAAARARAAARVPRAPRRA